MVNGFENIKVHKQYMQRPNPYFTWVCRLGMTSHILSISILNYSFYIAFRLFLTYNQINYIIIYKNTHLLWPHLICFLPRFIYIFFLFIDLPLLRWVENKFIRNNIYILWKNRIKTNFIFYYLVGRMKLLKIISIN